MKSLLARFSASRCCSHALKAARKSQLQFSNNPSYFTVLSKSSRVRGSSRVAFSKSDDQQSTNQEATGYERILRYPEGERLLRYPTVQESDEDETWSADYMDDRDDYEGQEHLNWDECELWGSACNPAAAYQTAPLPYKVSAPAQSDESVPAPDSVDLMQQLRLRQAEAWQQVRKSYQVLHGCPWVSHRPLFVIATQPNSDAEEGSLESDEVATLYTLRTRVDLNAADDMGQVFAGLDLGSRMSFSRMKDGIVAFEREADAEAFGATLSEEVADLIVCAVEVDSHELFILADELRGVVVHVGAQENQPLPYQLATVLQGNNDFSES